MNIEITVDISKEDVLYAIEEVTGKDDEKLVEEFFNKGLHREIQKECNESLVNLVEDDIKKKVKKYLLN